jgi:GNAT superfamily N-acetyltransferase
MIQLVPMNEDEFPAWLDLRVTLDAQYKVESEGYSPQEAEELVREEYAELLPEGVATPRQHLYHIVDQATGCQVGAIWFDIAPHIHRAFVMDFLIYQPFRRRGYGTQALLALEDLVRERGYYAIGLHVLGDNTPARRLYDKMGYVQTNLYAALTFNGDSPNGASPNAGRTVELLPMQAEQFQTYCTSLAEALAREQVRAGHWGAGYAMQMARQEYAGRLPKGHQTPDELLFTIADPALSSPVGALWVTRREFGGPTPKAIVQDLRIYPSRGRKAYQIAAIHALEDYAQKLQLGGVVFHLFSNEPLARLVVDKLGYHVTNVFMTKTLE